MINFVVRLLRSIFVLLLHSRQKNQTLYEPTLGYTKSRSPHEYSLQRCICLILFLSKLNLAPGVESK